MTNFPFLVEIVRSSQANEPVGGIAGSITFTGDLMGATLVQCEPDAAICMVRSMMMLGPDEELADEEVCDAIGEITNLVTGGIKSRIAETAGNIDISVPSVVTGKEVCPAVGPGADKHTLGFCAGDHSFAVTVISKAVAGG